MTTKTGLLETERTEFFEEFWLMFPEAYRIFAADGSVVIAKTLDPDETPQHPEFPETVGWVNLGQPEDSEVSSKTHFLVVDRRRFELHTVKLGFRTGPEVEEAMRLSGIKPVTSYNGSVIGIRRTEPLPKPQTFSAG